MSLKTAAVAGMLIASFAGGAQACVIPERVRGSHRLELLVLDTPRKQAFACTFRVQVLRILRAPRETRRVPREFELTISCNSPSEEREGRLLCAETPIDQISRGRRFRAELNRTQRDPSRFNMELFSLRPL